MKKALVFVISIISIFFCVTLVAHAQEDVIHTGTLGPLSWELNETTGVLTISGDGKIFDHPDAYKGTWMDYQDKIKTVIIDDGVTRIGSTAFYKCSSLISITLPESVISIGASAFSGCSDLVSITIPDNVTSIEASAFRDCKSLASITIPDDVTRVDEYAFCGCESLTGVTIPDNVKIIGKGAYSGCYNLESVIMGDGVKKICENAFGSCDSLKNLTIGNNVETIEYYAFVNCNSLISVVIPESITSMSTFAFEDCNKLVEVYNLSSLNLSSYFQNEMVIHTSLDEESILEVVDDFIFASWKNNNCLLGYIGNKTNIALPESYKGNNYEINQYAFYSCSSLTSIIIPDSVTSIGEYALYGCNSLTSVTIGNGITSIGNWAFYSCSSLTSVHITDLAKWCNISFNPYYSNPVYYAKMLYLNGELITDLVIPEGVTSIGDYAFNDCTSLTSVIIGNDVTSIGSYAFSNCVSLTSIKIPDSVTSIGNYAFYDCISINKVYIYSPDILNNIYSESSCGFITQNAKSIIVLEDATVSRHLIDNFTTKESILSGENVYVIYSNHAHEWEGDNCDNGLVCPQCTFIIDTHSFTNYKSDRNATCLTDGTKTAKCDRCIVTDTLTDEGSTLGHDYAAATCTVAKTCKRAECGATEGEPLGHNYADATCIAPMTCERVGCHSKVGEPLGHSFTNYVPDGNAACLEDGTKTAKCDRCAVTDTVDDIDSKHGHLYDSDCDTHCSGCGYERITDVHHSWDGGTITLEPTRRKNGTIRYVCLNCNITKTAPIPKISGCGGGSGINAAFISCSSVTAIWFALKRKIFHH